MTSFKNSLGRMMPLRSFPTVHSTKLSAGKTPEPGKEVKKKVI